MFSKVSMWISCLQRAIIGRFKYCMTVFKIVKFLDLMSICESIKSYITCIHGTVYITASCQMFNIRIY